MSNNKEFVAMATHICPICGVEHSYNVEELLIDKHMREIPKDKRCVGYGLCEEHAKLEEDGYIALIEADSNQSTIEDNGSILPENAHRTGRIMHIKREAAQQIFGPEMDLSIAMAYIDVEAFDQIAAMMPGEENEDNRRGGRNIPTQTLIAHLERTTKEDMK